MRRRAIAILLIIAAVGIVLLMAVEFGGKAVIDAAIRGEHFGPAPH